MQEEVIHCINYTDYNYDTICGWLLGGHCQNTELQPWTLEIPGNKPEPVHPEPVQVSPTGCTSCKFSLWCKVLNILCFMVGHMYCLNISDHLDN